MPDNNVFYRFTPLIQEFIYRNGWEKLRPVQCAAADIIFNTDDNLILASDTASGKTEAAFFPLITLLCEEFTRESVGVLYIAPLKSLINDQFYRLDELLNESEIPVYHWHGDVASSHKNKLLAHPDGILQITPESLESMLMHRHADIIRLFGSLKFVVIDEIHMLMGTDRGNQIICLLDRLAKIIGYHPRRIGLSATVGDIEKAAEYISGCTGRHTSVPSVPSANTEWRLAIEHFFIQNKTDSGENPVVAPEKKVALDAGYEYMYDCATQKKSLVFSNSREETEYVTSTLRQIAERRGERDIFYIHHGNLSAAIREEAETKLKEDTKCVACATVTLELGIDIGKLERVIQVGSPNKVASFLQRLGRSGRRGDPPEMFMVVREENPMPDTPLPQLIPWEMLRGIAIIQVFLEDRFIEPPMEKKMPLSLMFQQTLSILASGGELTAKELAQSVLSLSPFKNVDREDYRELLVSMVNDDYLEMTDEKTLIVGLKGEKLTNSFKFFAVFKDSEDYSVKCGSEEIGTIASPLPVGDRFALAGRVWEVEELDLSKKLIYVISVKGKMQISWPGDFGEINTAIVNKIRKILTEDTVYPYLKPNARDRLAAARRVARNSGMVDYKSARGSMMISLGGNTKAFFPWLGTRSFRTLRKYLKKNAAVFGISGVEFEGCYYMTFKSDTQADILLGKIADRIISEEIDTRTLISPSELPVFEKYDPFIPPELLRRAYAEDRLRTDEMKERMAEIYK